MAVIVDGRLQVVCTGCEYGRKKARGARDAKNEKERWSPHGATGITATTGLEGWVGLGVDVVGCNDDDRDQNKSGEGGYSDSRRGGSCPTNRERGLWGKSLTGRSSRE